MPSVTLTGVCCPALLDGGDEGGVVRWREISLGEYEEERK